MVFGHHQDGWLLQQGTEQPDGCSLCALLLTQLVEQNNTFFASDSSIRPVRIRLHTISQRKTLRVGSILRVIWGSDIVYESHVTRVIGRILDSVRNSFKECSLKIETSEGICLLQSL
jgi:hypothetical protein